MKQIAQSAAATIAHHKMLVPGIVQSKICALISLITTRKNAMHALEIADATAKKLAIICLVRVDTKNSRVVAERGQ